MSLNKIFIKPVETLADIEKEIEKEFAFLTWLEYMEIPEAKILAKKTIYEKYPELIKKLKIEGKL